MDAKMLKAAVLGTEDYHGLMREAALSGLQVQAGYVPMVLNERVLQGFQFTVHTRIPNHPVSFDIVQCEAFRLDERITLHIWESEYREFTVRYSHVYVFQDFVLFCWADADTTHFEWAHIEISRRDLIEMQHESNLSQLQCL
jgi:hypothetical protein